MNDDVDRTGEVIADIGAASEDRIYAPPITRRRFSVIDGDRCQHRRTVVDEKLRRVTCHSCGETLDPVQVLIELAQRYESSERRAELQARREAEAWENARERDRNAEERRRAFEDRFPDGHTILIAPNMGDVSHRFLVHHTSLCGHGNLYQHPTDRPTAKPECRNCERSAAKVIRHGGVVFVPIRLGPPPPPIRTTVVSDRGVEEHGPKPELVE